MKKRRAVYPGTFDPITAGHLDILSRSLTLFDEVVVALANNTAKSPLFSLAERTEFIRNALSEAGTQQNVVFDAFDGLLVEYCKRNGMPTIIRGLRAPSDFEYEFQLAVMNRRLGPTVDTVFLMTAEENFYVSSSLIKEIARFGGDVTGMVPDQVKEALQKKFPQGKP